VLLVRTPYRISFFGGGTDYPPWYKKEDNYGIVLSATINKYSHIFLRQLPPFFEHKYRVRYFKSDYVNLISEIKHPVVRQVAKNYGMLDGFELVHSGDLPARSGLGSSSSFTVGLIQASASFNGLRRTKRQLAIEAIDIEQNQLGEAVGSQDQVAAAFGGLNIIRFGGKPEFEVEPITVSGDRLRELDSHLLLAFTGISRTASVVATKKIMQIPNRSNELNSMIKLCEEATDTLVSSKNIEEFGKMLDQQWQLKKSLAKEVTNPVIDDIYDVAMKAGAIGGKLLGAGGGGFILFFAKPEYHSRIKSKLSNLLFVPFQFENLGSQIVYFS
jgi:D-glycero-alpha-D-manno-heptose-7-phosphate kinase